MSEIPNSVMDVAKKAVINATQRKRIIAVALAIMEERERCASMAEKYSDGVYAAMAVRGEMK